MRNSQQCPKKAEDRKESSQKIGSSCEHSQTVEYIRILQLSIILYLLLKFILSTFSFFLISFNIACVCTFVARCWSYSIVLLQYRRSVILDKIFVTHGLLKTIVWRNGIQLHLFNLINAASTMQLNIQSINHMEPQNTVSVKGVFAIDVSNVTCEMQDGINFTDFYQRLMVCRCLKGVDQWLVVVKSSQFAAKVSYCRAGG